MSLAIDMTGKRFGHLTVIGKSLDRERYWDCVCVCGIKKSIHGSSLRSGTTKSCGCRKEADKRLTLDGIRNGMLTYIKEAGIVNERRRIVLRCACGNEFETWAFHFISGELKSCGCYKAAAAKERSRTLGTRYGRKEDGTYRGK